MSANSIAHIMAPGSWDSPFDAYGIRATVPFRVIENNEIYRAMKQILHGSITRS